MSWIRPNENRKTYETDDYEEYKFLSRSTNWNVVYTGGQDTEAAQERSKSFDVDETLRQAYAQQGLDYEARSRTGASEDTEYAVTTDAELNSLVRRAKAEIQQERESSIPDSPFKQYSQLIANSYKLEVAGATKEARKGYSAAISFLNGLERALFEANPNKADAREMIQNKRSAVKKRIANL